MNWVSIGSGNGLAPNRRQWCCFINSALSNTLQWNLDLNYNIFYEENAFEDVVCEIAAILSRGRWVNYKDEHHILEAIAKLFSWWRHQMETFSALLAICAGNSPVPSEFPTQRPVTRSFGVFFDQRLNKLLNKQSSGWWFETLPRPLSRHSNAEIVEAIDRIITGTHCIMLCSSHASLSS